MKLSKLVCVCLAAGILVASPTAKSQDGMKIHGTRLWFFLPQECTQNRDDNWVQCKNQNGEFGPQFNFEVGKPTKAPDKKYWTQESLAEKNIHEIETSEPLREFKNRANDWAQLQISKGGSIDSPLEFDQLKNDQGVYAIYASWTYTNANGVQLLGFYYDVWDRGQTINIEVNLPMRSDDQMKINADLVGDALKTMDLR